MYMNLYLIIHHTLHPAPHPDRGALTSHIDIECERFHSSNQHLTLIEVR